MPVIIAVLGVLVAAFIWMQRARAARDVAGELLDVANDVRLAARRFGFRRKTNTHPVDDIESASVAVATLSLAFVEMADLPSKEDHDTLAIGLAQTCGVTSEEAYELLVLARWLIGQCGGAQQAAVRVAQKLHGLEGDNGALPFLTIAQKALRGRDMTPAQQDVLADVQRRFRLG